MLARGLAIDFPTIQADTDALEAARLLQSERLPGLVVLAHDGKPMAVLPAFQVARFVVPVWIQVDPALAHVLDEASADHLCDRLAGLRVRDLLPQEKRTDALLVRADNTAMEIAEVMEHEHSPLVAVVDDDGRYLGAITLFELLGALLPG